MTGAVTRAPGAAVAAAGPVVVAWLRNVSVLSQDAARWRDFGMRRGGMAGLSERERKGLRREGVASSPVGRSSHHSSQAGARA